MRKKNPNGSNTIFIMQNSISYFLVLGEKCDLDMLFICYIQLNSIFQHLHNLGLVGRRQDFLKANKVITVFGLFMTFYSKYGS